MACRKALCWRIRFAGVSKAQRATDRPCLGKALRYDPGGYDVPMTEAARKVLVLKKGRGRANDDLGYAISVYSIL